MLNQVVLFLHLKVSQHIYQKATVCTSCVFMLIAALLSTHNMVHSTRVCLHVGKMAPHHQAASHYITQHCGRLRGSCLGS